jgi:hypothetical protein
VTIGLFGAAIAPAAVLSIALPIDGRYDLISISGSFVVYLPIAMGAVLVLGMPAFFFLRRFGPGSWWLALLVGLLLSVPLLFVLPGLRIINAALVLSPLSALSALIFWWCWRQGSRVNGAGSSPSTEAPPWGRGGDGAP